MKKNLSLFLTFIFTISGMAQHRNTNMDEKKVSHFLLPEVLTYLNNEKITSVDQWEKQRRPELLNLFAKEMYGEAFTDTGIKKNYETLTENTNALNGKAICKQVKITFSKENLLHEAYLLIYLPKTKKKSPVFLAYNFNGNHTVNSDPEILISPSLPKISSEDQTLERGKRANRWSIDMIIDEGFGLATICYHDFYPDDKDLKEESILPLFNDYETKRTDPHAIQAIGTWAWGLSSVMDYLQTEKQIDSEKVVLMGHSRLGKASLWAGAQDQRFAIIIANNSGSGGAALSKRKFGETIEVITTNFPHWFCPAFNNYANNENALSFDQHELIALIAPRPVYIASAQDDSWADPKGEFLSGVYASPAYKLYGLNGIETDVMPELNTPIMNHIGYHIRTGKHDVTEFDWKCYLLFAKKHLGIN